MKIRFLTMLIVLGVGLLTNCNKDDNTTLQFESTAKILGFDYTECACCGGWIIEINGEENDRRFSELPSNSNIDLDNIATPIDVQLNWSESNEYCGKGILIESVRLIN